MKNLLNPKVLFAVHTAPIIILIMLLGSRLSLIYTLLNRESLRLWMIFGCVFIFLVAVNVFYAVYAAVKKKKICAVYAAVSLIIHLTVLYLYYWQSPKLFPSSIPLWMYSGRVFFHAVSFFMPFIFYTIFVLAASFTSDGKETHPLINFAAAALIPLAGYLYITLIFPLFHPAAEGFWMHMFIVIFISATVTFLFFVMRAVYVLLTKKKITETENATAGANFRRFIISYSWKIIFTCILPQAGLFFNNTGIGGAFTQAGIFGNFSSRYFYILAALNGIFLCLPSTKNKGYRLCLFTARGLTFLFSLYFFFVFLPFLPLSVIFIIFAGAGFLMLTPIIVLIFHVHTLAADISFLKSYFSKPLILFILIISFFPIPAAITFSYASTRAALHSALEYVYEPDYQKEYKIDTAGLRKALEAVEQNNRNDDLLFLQGNQPFLSAYFNYIVLDNLSLSSSKILKLKKIFLDESESFTQSEISESSVQEIEEALKAKLKNNETAEVKLSKVNSQSVYNDKLQAWKTLISLELTNAGRDFEEYSTEIALPEGCWVSGYYLYVGNKKESGLLTEKKSALWVFSQIKNERRDPGIVYYSGADKVTLKVYPFMKNEVRKTEIEFLHKTPTHITIDGIVIVLGKENDTPSGTQHLPAKNFYGAYLPASYKQTLKKVKREPYFHFIIDSSFNGAGKFEKFNTHIEKLAETHPHLFKNAKMSFTNAYVRTVPFVFNWRKEYERQVFKGGFFVERAIRQESVNAYKNGSRPIFIIVGDRFFSFAAEPDKNLNNDYPHSSNLQKKEQVNTNWILDGDFSDLEFTFPESSLFFFLNENGLTAHSLVNRPAIPFFKEEPVHTFDAHVLEYIREDGRTLYLRDDGQASVILRRGDFDNTADENEKDDSYKLLTAFNENGQGSAEKNWFYGLDLRNAQRLHALYPYKAARMRLELIRKSFASKILSPFTAFIVVENEAQKNMLLKKQKEVLAGSYVLDADDPESASAMSEPALLLLICAVLAAFILLRLGQKVHN